MREENDFIKILQSCRENLNELKSSQKIAGDSWIVYRNATDNTWDIQETLGIEDYKRWLITFEPEFEREAVASVQVSEESSGIFDRYIIQKYGSKYQWYYIFRTDFDISDTSSIKAKFIISSTQKGTVSVISA